MASGWKRHKKVTKVVKKLCRDKAWLFLSGFFNISKVIKIHSSLIFKPFFPSQQTNSFFSCLHEDFGPSVILTQIHQDALGVNCWILPFFVLKPLLNFLYFLILLFTVAAGTWIRFKVFPCLVRSHNVQLEVLTEFFGFSHDLKLIKNWPKHDYMRCSQLIACLNAQC